MRPIFPAATGAGLPPPPLALPAVAPAATAARPPRDATATGGVGVEAEGDLQVAQAAMVELRRQAIVNTPFVRLRGADRGYATDRGDEWSKRTHRSVLQAESTIRVMTCNEVRNGSIWGQLWMPIEGLQTTPG